MESRSAQAHGAENAHECDGLQPVTLTINTDAITNRQNVSVQAVSPSGECRSIIDARVDEYLSGGGTDEASTTCTITAAPQVTITNGVSMSINGLSDCAVPVVVSVQIAPEGLVSPAHEWHSIDREANLYTHAPVLGTHMQYRFTTHGFWRYNGNQVVVNQPQTQRYSRIDSSPVYYSLQGKTLYFFGTPTNKARYAGSWTHKPLLGPRQYIAGYSQITMLGNGGYHCDFYFNATDQELEFINPIAYCGP